MTTIIRVVCSDCTQQQAVTPPDVHVLLVPGHPTLNTYAFRCPSCSAAVVKVATPEIVNMLRSGGVRIITLSADPDAAALTYDDLLDFALHLGVTDLLAEVAQMEMQR